MSWLDYYLPIMGNSENEEKFLEKYDPFLKLISDICLKVQPNFIVEEGCGTGIVSKLVLQKNYTLILKCLQGITLGDIDANMLDLSRINLGNTYNETLFLLSDITDIKYFHERRCPPAISPCDLVITHGVLEHFDVTTIVNILTKYNNTERVGAHVHYIPTSGYKTKSFGDENLWDLKFWTSIIYSSLTPHQEETFKTIIYLNGPDLYFAIIKNK